tara:strand:- start:872 stop:1171 length:300 start_codon:yes stop_codon:yes gene_type:complete
MEKSFKINAICSNIFLKKDRLPALSNYVYAYQKEAHLYPPYSGEVLSLGEDIDDEDLEVGCRVTFNDMAGEEIQYEGETYLLIRYHNVTSVIGKDVKIA